MSNQNQPLSPHLQIYKWQLTMTLSILHRITGAGLALGAIPLALWLGAAWCSDESFAQVQAFRDSLIGQVMLFGWLYAFVYHMLNGLRHLAWDNVIGLDLKSAYRTGWTVVIASVVLTLWIWGGF